MIDENCYDKERPMRTLQCVRYKLHRVTVINSDELARRAAKELLKEIDEYLGLD